MLELPEAKVISVQLQKTVCNKTIQEVTMNASPHKFAGMWEHPQTTPPFSLAEVLMPQHLMAARWNCVRKNTAWSSAMA